MRKIIDVTGLIDKGMWNYDPPFPEINIVPLPPIPWLGGKTVGAEIFEGLHSQTGTYLETPAHHFGNSGSFSGGSGGASCAYARLHRQSRSIRFRRRRSLVWSNIFIPPFLLFSLRASPMPDVPGRPVRSPSSSSSASITGSGAELTEALPTVYWV